MERKKSRAVGLNHVALEVGDIDQVLAFSSPRRHMCCTVWSSRISVNQTAL